MQHIHDVIRKHLEERCLFAASGKQPAEENVLINSVYDLARNRMNMGAYRYGNLSDKISPSYIPAIRARLDEYARTHNTENLIDIMNIAMIEFLYPTFRDAHFTPVDDGIHCL